MRGESDVHHEDIYLDYASKLVGLRAWVARAEDVCAPPKHSYTIRSSTALLRGKNCVLKKNFSVHHGAKIVLLTYFRS